MTEDDSNDEKSGTEVGSCVKGSRIRLRLRHIGKTDPQCGTVQFCYHSGRLTCSARNGFRAVTTPLELLNVSQRHQKRIGNMHSIFGETKNMR